MKKTNITLFVFLSIFLLLASCKKEESKTPDQIERENIMAIEDLLRSNQWGFKDLNISVQYESRATPLMVNVADENGMVQPGHYDSYDIFGDNNRQLNYVYEFTRDDILLDPNKSGDFARIGGYYVINTSDIRINLDTVKAIRFAYSNLSDENTFLFQANSIHSEDYLNSVNNTIIAAILNDRPSAIADAFVNFILENDKVSEEIEQLLYDLIHGKVVEITQSPEDISEKLAIAIMDKLTAIDWESILYDRILEALQELQVDNPEETATELAKRISDKIEASISQSDIYSRILPILQDFENETLPILASRIAASVYEQITSVITEENIYNRIYPVWESFMVADSSSVTEIADSLSNVVTNHFFNADTLTQKLIPFINKLDETSTLQLGAIANEIIDSVLMPVVNNINNTFPSLDLQPDWTTIKPYITSVLTVLKGALGSSTIEELSFRLAEGVIGVMNLSIKTGFEKAIFRLQLIPAEQASQVIAAWIINLTEIAEQPIVDFIEQKLDTLFEQFESELIAENLSLLIHNKLLEAFNEENIYQLILPILNQLQQADMEVVAQEITEWLIELDLIPDTISKEQAIEKLTLILSELIGNINPDEATERLVALIIENDLVQGIDGNLLSRVIEFKLYEFLYTIAREANTIENIEISIQQK